MSKTQNENLVIREPQISFTVTKTIEFPVVSVWDIVKHIPANENINRMKHLRETFPDKRLTLSEARQIILQIGEMEKVNGWNK